MLQKFVDLTPSTFILVTVGIVLALLVGVSTGWLMAHWAATKDADDGDSFIFWRTRRYRVIPDDYERKQRHKHGTMAEQSWP